MKKEDLLIRLNEENLIKEWDLSNFEKKEIYNLNEKALWVCEKGHEWEAKIANRLYLKRGCPYCKGGKVCQENNLEIKRPDCSKHGIIKKTIYLLEIYCQLQPKRFGGFAMMDMNGKLLLINWEILKLK